MSDYPIIGQRVICINGKFGESWQKIADVAPNLPVQGKHYTIRGIGECQYRDHGLLTILPCIWLEELVNLSTQWGGGWYGEIGFVLSRFAPVRKTDISIFTEMLK